MIKLLCRKFSFVSFFFYIKPKQNTKENDKFMFEAGTQCHQLQLKQKFIINKCQKTQRQLKMTGTNTIATENKNKTKNVSSKKR